MWIAYRSDGAVDDCHPGKFRWDEQGAYLFDIDGTLLRSRDRIHVNSFFSSVRAVLGRELVLEGVTLSGNTDPGMIWWPYSSVLRFITGRANSSTNTAKN